MTKELFKEIIKLNEKESGSDIHISADNKIGLRIMGRLKKQEKYGQMTIEDTIEFFNITQEFLQESAQIFVKKQLEENGHSAFSILVDDTHRFRINAANYKGGFYIVLRTLTAEPADLDTLGFSDSIFKGLSMIANKKAGLFLVVGPTGSGKSTTLSAMIKQINQSFEKNIITLEDPVEYTHTELKSNIIQKELGRDMSSFLEGLKAALREDPDVILIGEIRDAETLGLALKAAETGHLVFSTLHTDNTVSTIKRITSMTDNEKLTRDRLSSSLLGVIAQRLEPIQPISKEEAMKTGRKERGARILNYEMLTFTGALLNVLKEGGQDQQIAGSLDNTPNSQSYSQTLINYYKEGIISEREALRLATDKKDMQYRLETEKED